MTSAGWLKPKGMEAWNDLVGGVPQGTQTALIGQARAGKTILTNQLAYATANVVGGSALIVDTEGSTHTYADWQKAFDKRYQPMELVFLRLGIDGKKGTASLVSDVKHDRKKNYLYVLDCRDLIQILALHGRPARIESSDKGKMSIKPAGQFINNVLETPIGEFMQERDIFFLGYDSFTNPLAIFGTERENFPARANATTWWVLQAQLLAQTLALVEVGVFHETVDPANPWGRPGVAGGNAINYNQKLAVYVEHEKTMRTPGVEESFDKGKNRISRNFWLMRHPSRQPWTRCTQLVLTSKGFIDVEQAQLKAEKVKEE